MGDLAAAGGEGDGAQLKRVGSAEEESAGACCCWAPKPTGDGGSAAVAADVDGSGDDEVAGQVPGAELEARRWWLAGGAGAR